jgi:hypothetical protein
MNTGCTLGLDRLTLHAPMVSLAVALAALARMSTVSMQCRSPNEQFTCKKNCSFGLRLESQFSFAILLYVDV